MQSLCHIRIQISSLFLAICLDPDMSAATSIFLGVSIDRGPRRKATALHLQLFQFLISTAELMLLVCKACS